MKKNGKMKLLCMLATVMVASIVAVFVNISTGEKPDIVRAIENVENIPETTSMEYASSYAVGETFSISNYETILNGENQKTYAILQKNYKVYAALTPEDEYITYKFTEAGEYNLIYYYVTDTYARKVVRNVEFSVVSGRAYFDIFFQNEYLINTELEVEARCIQGNQSVFAQLQVINPLGVEVLPEVGTLQLTQSGVYSLKYSAVIGEETIERIYYVRVTSIADTYKGYFSSISGLKSVQDNMEAQDFAQPGCGVGITLDAVGEFRFNNIIDLNGMTKDDELIKMLPLSEGEYNPLTQFSVKLIDVYDASNVIEYVFVRRDSSTGTWMGSWTYCNIRYKNTTYAINANKGEMFINSYYGVGSRICCNAARLKEQYAGGMYYGYAPWVRCQVDYEDKAFYIYGGGDHYVFNKQCEVVDLDEPTQIGYGNEWSGFTTGEVYLQVELQAASGDQSGCIVQEIAGQPLYGEKQDKGKPHIYFSETENNMLPKGLTDVFYPFPKVMYTNDIIEGTIFYPDYSIVKLEYEIAQNLKYSELNIPSQEGFTPKKAGVYRVTYKVADGSGNIGERTISFKVDDSFGEKGVHYEFNSELYVGQTIELPKFTPIGLSYIVKKFESVKYNGEECLDKAKEVFLDKAGSIIINCEYEDYLGTVYEIEEEYEVIVKDEAVVKLKGIVPKYALKGRTIVLPDYTAINYALNEKVDWALTVDGRNIDVEAREITIDGNHNDILEVVYTAGNVEERYEIKVIDAKYLSDRFYTTSGEVAMSDTEEYVGMTVEQDSSIEYVFPFLLTKEVLTFDFKFNLSAKTEGFDSVDMYFEDYLDASKQIFLRMEQSKTGISVQVNGKGAKFEIPTETVHNGYAFTYSQAECSFQFQSNVKIDKTVNGEAFNGFTSNRFLVWFVFNGVQEPVKMSLYQMGAVTFISNYSENGELLEYIDTMYPTLVSEHSYLENSFKYGSVALIPGMEARTALSGLCQNSITIISPSGVKIVNRGNGYSDYEIELTEYGEYKLEYTVPFRSSTKKYSFRFTVHKDILPEVSLASDLRDTYNKSETLTIPEAVVTNAAKGYTVDYFIVMPNGLTTILKDEKTITLDQTGTYVLRVLVKDTYNVISKSWKFKVEV